MHKRFKFINSTILFLLLVISVQSCSKDYSDVRENMREGLDKSVEEEYIPNYSQAEAIEFLEKGGHFIEMGDPEDQKIDVPHVVPLLKRLGKEFGMEWIAFSPHDDKDFAEVIAAKIPPGVSREQVHLVLVDIQKNFPGDILQEWGNRWFSIDFLDQEESEMLRELEAEMDK